MKIEELLEFGNLNGVMCTEVPHEKEDNPTRYPAEAEKIISKNRANSYIVLGKDRMGDVYSGFGGRGFPDSNAIDICVGMGQTTNSKILTKKDVVNPNPFVDSSRVYISQRTDLDGMFGVNKGIIYPLDRSQGISGAAMKADMVLVLGRRNVKIKAGQSQGEGMPRGGERDSFNSKLPDARIDLIADAPLEPMVRGQKLVDCITNIYGQIKDNRIYIGNLITQLLKLRIAIMMHTHPAAVAIAFPSPELIGSNVDEIPKDIQELMSSITNSFGAAVEELNCVIIPNRDKYILSKNVFTS